MGKAAESSAFGKTVVNEIRALGTAQSPSTCLHDSGASDRWAGTEQSNVRPMVGARFLTIRV